VHKALALPRHDPRLVGGLLQIRSGGKILRRYRISRVVEQCQTNHRWFLNWGWAGSLWLDAKSIHRIVQVEIEVTSFVSE
jgi:hypothetical protein